MAKDSAIQWTTHTFNPWWGCLKISPACDHCYAESFAKRVGQKVWGGAASPRRFFGDKHWAEPLKWNKQAGTYQHAWERGVELCGSEKEAMDRGFIKPERPRVFCASMADVFEDREDLIPHRARLFELIAATPNLDWLLLTKRPENWSKHVEQILQFIEATDAYNQDDPKAQAARDWLADWFVLRKAPANVWMGTTVENQEYADERIPELLLIPARVRFLSCEPLLGPVNFTEPLLAAKFKACESVPMGQILRGDLPPFPWIDWIITGGESGGKARTSDLDWFRSLRDQCSAAGVAFFMKQLGGVRDARGDIDQFPEDLPVRQFPTGKEYHRG